MATIESFIKDFENKLTCSICHNIFTDPKTLSCLHSYCIQCIAQLYARSGDQVQKKMDCPICKTTIDVPDNDPSKLRSSSYLNSLLQLLEAMKRNTSNQQGLSDCVSCEKPKALVAFCPQCDGSICEECFETHKNIKQLRDKHQPAKFVEFTDDNVKSFVESKMVCKEKLHKEQKLEYFCQEEACRRCVCQMCFALNHKSHQLKSIEEAAEDVRKDIQESINRAQQMKETFEKTLEKSKENTERNRQEIELAKTEVRHAEEIICTMVRDQCTTMISALDQTLQKQTAANDKVCVTIKDGIDQLSSFMQQWQELENKGALCELIESKVDHEAVCGTLLGTPHSFVTAETVQQDVTALYMTAHQVIQMVIAKIRSVMTDPSQCTFHSLNDCYSFNSDFYIITRNTEGEVCPTRIDFIDVSIKDVEGNEVKNKLSEEQTGKFHVIYEPQKNGTHEIQVHIGGVPIKSSPQIVNVIEVKPFGKKGCGKGELNSPQSIAVSDNGEIAIADSLNHRIQIFSHDGTFLRNFCSKGTGEDKLYFPFAVVFNEDRVIISDGPHDDIKLKEFDLNGTYIKTIKRPEEWLVGHGMCVNEDKNIAVCCRGNQEMYIKPSIKVFSKQGDLIHEFDMPDDNEQPEYITYSDGKYFVSCDLNYVRVFDANGVFLYKFGEPGKSYGQFDGVRGLAAYGPQMILVCDSGNHRLQLFTREGHFIRSFGSYGISIGQMKEPIDVVATADGQVYVLEFESSRVQIWKWTN